jgi:hypothetical protein
MAGAATGGREKTGHGHEVVFEFAIWPSWCERDIGLLDAEC